MGLLNNLFTTRSLITVTKITQTALVKSEEGFFITAGFVRKGARIYFVFRTSKWDDAAIEAVVNAAFPEDDKPEIYSLPFINDDFMQ